MASFLSRLLGRHDVGGGPPDSDHPVPAEIDLGVQRSWEVEMGLEALRGVGGRVQMNAQSEHTIVGGMAPRHCRVLVHADDEADVRAELTEAGFL